MQMMAKSRQRESSPTLGKKKMSYEQMKRERSHQKTLAAQNDRSIYYKDVALIRYKEGEVQVVNDTGFMNTFHRRANDDYWKSVRCIQTNIKSKIGCGKPIIIKFYAPIDVQ
mmetsp:Transcript_36979/g.35688  ORF Transcript_36979/g.35688 Transcript_36979/m.35688 type:complete len:112 (+) Transcript_36979:581-916(+)